MMFSQFCTKLCVFYAKVKRKKERNKYMSWNINNGFFLCKQMIYSKAYTALCLLVYSLILCFAFITCESKLRGKSSKLGRWRGGCLRLEKTLARPA